MGNSKKTAAVVGTGFIGPVHVEALRRIGIDVASLAWDSEHPNDLWIGYRDKPNELLIRDPSLLAPEIKAFASYPGGHNEGFPDTFKQLYRAIMITSRRKITHGQSFLPILSMATGKWCSARRS